MNANLERQLQDARLWLADPNQDIILAYFARFTLPSCNLIMLCQHLSDEEMALFASKKFDVEQHGKAISIALFAVAKRLLADFNFVSAQEVLRHPLLRDIDTSELRLGLIGHTYHLLPADEIFEILAPTRNRLFGSVDSFILHLSWLVCAAFAAGELGFALSVAQAIGDARDRDPPATPPAQAIVRRLILLAGWDGMPDDDGAAEPDDWDRVSRDCLLRLDEWSMLQGLSQLSRLPPPTADRAVRRIALLAATTRAESWAMAYRSVLDLAAGAIAAGMAEADLYDAAVRLGLSGETFVYAGRRALPSADGPDPLGDLAAFKAAPSLASARRIWAGMAGRGDAEAIIRYAALDEAEMELARLAVATRDAAVETVPIWLFMTWRDHVPRLLSNLANLQSRKGRIIVSVGGSGHPAGIEQASAAMLVPRIFFLNRAPLTWGGPKLLFQTVLEIMALFRAIAPEGSWMQVICDRTVPLRPMDEIAHLMVNPKNLAKLSRYQGVMPAWDGEFHPHQVDDLPRLLERSIDSVFESVDTAGLQDIAGPFPYHPGMRPDHRLDSFSFNFAGTPRSAQTNPNGDDQIYAVSPYDADMRWMSFARLHEFVDVSPETAITYSRRMPPATQAWVHRTLRNQRLCNGSPFVFFSRVYADALLNREDFSETFAAMNMGFGPEMNYFDTMAATMGAGENFMHNYATIEGGIFEDRHIAAVSYSVDAEDYMFARKSEPNTGAEILRHFSDRQLLAGDRRETHWVAAFSSGPHGADLLPAIDGELIRSLVDRDFLCRDMLGRMKIKMQLRSDGTVWSEEAGIDGTWSLEPGALTVEFGRSDYGTKRYVGIAASADRLVLAPEELVGPFNRWSLFLDFALDGISHSSDRLTIGTGVSVLAPCRWYGSSNFDTCVLAPFAQGDGALPIPVLAEDGCILEFRDAGPFWLALVRIAGLPSLLRLRGAAYANGQTLYTFTKASEDEARGWDAALPNSPYFRLSAEQIGGRWQLETLEGETELTFETDGAIHAGGTAVGRWILRTDGLQLFGIEGLRVGLASQRRVEDGAWRLSGWGYARIGKKVSFALAQIAS
ncbi:hypothetical protein ABIC16_004239 [Sphingomonas sp. PvP055]|uniref:hypothetical protein n=1 Tax=Sphingomonas sp. PvP055 TaxID=3156391 RepID=UPI00339705F9